MRWLQQSSGETQTVLPGVLRPRLRGTFADIRAEKLKIWQEMCRAAVDYEFDLVYAPKAWEEVMLAVEEGRIAADGEDLIYYHSGGLEGNDSMLGRSRSAMRAFYVFCDAVMIMNARLFPDTSCLCYFTTRYSYLFGINFREVSTERSPVAQLYRCVPSRAIAKLRATQTLLKQLIAIDG